MTSNTHDSPSFIRKFCFERSFYNLKNDNDKIWRILHIQETFPIEDHDRAVNPTLNAENGDEHLLPAHRCCVKTGKGPGG